MDWVIRLERLDEGPVTLAGRLPADPDFWAAPGLTLTHEPEVRLTARAGGRGAVHVGGSLRAEVELECRRCLRPLRTALPLELDLWLQPGLRPGEGDEGVFPLPHDAAELDLREPLREELLLSLPEFPLCREECAGLCPRCGSDLNEGPCGCVPEAGDPRWVSLREQRPEE